MICWGGKGEEEEDPRVRGCCCGGSGSSDGGSGSDCCGDICGCNCCLEVIKGEKEGRVGKKERGFIYSILERRHGIRGKGGIKHIT